MKGMNSVVCAGLFAGMLSAAFGGSGVIEVRNAGFEDIGPNGEAEGWRHRPSFRAEKGAGFNGSGGLVWSSEKPTTEQEGVLQFLPEMEKGGVYRFSFLVRAENFKGGYVCCCIEWYDDKDKWLGGAYTHGFNTSGTDWMTVEGNTKPIPDKTASCRLMVYMTKGSSGRVFLDNVTISAFERAPVGFVVSSRYRDTAAKGTVSFFAALNLPRETDEKELSARFTVVGTDGRARTVPAQKVTRTEASAVCEVASLADGTHPVRCELFRKGKKVGEAVRDFTRVGQLPKRRVWIDRFNRCIVDGKPFFPNGMYWGRVEREKLDVYAKGPFNCLMAYGYTTRQTLDLVGEYGLKMMSDVRDYASCSRWARQTNRDVARLDKELAARMAEMKDHPALLAWYVNDESPITEIPSRTHLYETIVANDADHPAYAVGVDSRSFRPSYDVIGIDPYPVAERPVGEIAVKAEKAMRDVFGACAVWNVPQGFDWGWFRPDDAPKQRFPTLDEYRSMCWQHVAAGANGLVGYCFYKFWEPKDAKAEKRSAYFREEHWQTICAVGEEVKRLSPVMLSVDPAPAVTGATDAVRVRTWSCEGNLYVLAVNRLNETAEATLQIAGGGWKTAKAELGAEQELADGGQLKIRLGPLGVSFVRLSTKL